MATRMWGDHLMAIHLTCSSCGTRSAAHGYTPHQLGQAIVDKGWEVYVDAYGRRVATCRGCLNSREREYVLVAAVEVCHAAIIRA